MRTMGRDDERVGAQSLVAFRSPQSAESWGMSDPVQKITFAEMRAAGVRGVLIYCSDYRCSHSICLDADRWPDAVRLSLAGRLDPTLGQGELQKGDQAQCQWRPGP